MTRQSRRDYGAGVSPGIMKSRMRKDIQTLAWYDRLATVYNLTRDYPYRSAPRRAIDRLSLTPGECVFDLFCGAGVNLPLLHERVSPAGHVVGVDGSSAMLSKAVRATEHLDSVELVRSDFSDAGCRLALQERIRADGPAAFLFTLGLTCLRDWSEFFASVFHAADPGARFSIMDVYSNRHTFGARFVNWIGAGDCTRPVWRELERLSPSFVQEKVRPFRFLDVSVLISSGTKGEAAQDQL